MAKVTEIYLLSTPFTLKQNETMLFTSKSSQNSYMTKRIKHSYTNFSMQRQNKSIKVPDFIDNIFDSNYLMYRNSQNGKWYYCFITGYEYINDNCTEITFKFDVLQTYMFDYNVKPCLVEREHVNNDTIGINTVDEGIELGELKRTEITFETGLNDLVYIMGSKYTINSNGDVEEGGATFRNGILSCISLRKYEKSEFADLFFDIEKIENKKENSILFISAIPRFALSTSIINGKEINSSGEIPSKKIDVELNLNNVDGYIPKNNKLYVYPYNSLIVSNNNQEKLLKIEEFHSNNVSFYVKSFISSNPIVKVIPYYYKNVILNYEESLDYSSFPQVEYSTDAYKSFINSAMQGIFANIVATGVNLYNGNSIGALLSASNVATGINAYNLKSDNLNGNGVSGQLSLLDKRDFKIYRQYVQGEHAKIIDDYFSRYCYKVNMVKIPNHNGRENFNYIKTINCLCVGDIPSNDLEEIQNIYDKGITFWHNIENYGDYTVNNSIV